MRSWKFEPQVRFLVQQTSLLLCLILPSPLHIATAASTITFLPLDVGLAMASGDQRQQQSPPAPLLAIATRIHLGHATKPPDDATLRRMLTSFSSVASSVGAHRGVVAVDSQERIEGYDLASEVTSICRALDGDAKLRDEAGRQVSLEVLPVTPWGRFVPALNAIVAWAAGAGCDRLLLASAEVALTSEAMGEMSSRLDGDTTLVVGARLQGHDHRGSGVGGKGVEVELDGRTTPWNTCALWNLPKLALTGFQLVSEGLHGGVEAGVEEAVTIACLQRILGPGRAVAKLVSIEGTSWEKDFGDDDGRREWHERKMRSKVERAAAQLDLMGLGGTVIHC